MDVVVAIVVAVLVVVVIVVVIVVIAVVEAVGARAVAPPVPVFDTICNASASAGAWLRVRDTSGRVARWRATLQPTPPTCA